MEYCLFDRRSRTRRMGILLCFLAIQTIAQPQSITRKSRPELIAIDENDRVVMHGNVHPRINSAQDIGRQKANIELQRTILLLYRRPGAGREIDALLHAQQDPLSPEYHKWLTPAEFGKRFGIDDSQLLVVTDWLARHGLKVDEVAKGRGWINFSGNVAAIEQTFRTEMHDYSINGELHHANSLEPSIPRALAPFVSGVVKLNDFHSRPLHRVMDTVNVNSIPEFSQGGKNYISPGDFQIIYDTNNLSGATRTAIVGRTDINLSDMQGFGSLFGGATPVVNIIHNGPDPGIVSVTEETEADIDVTWASAPLGISVIDLVVSQSTSTTDGVDLSAQYIVDNNLDPVMSTSFGACESGMGQTELAFFNNLWQQADAQGITSVVASGDSGAAGCDLPTASKGTGLAVSGICSTPYNLCVGGTEFSEGSGNYWTTTYGYGVSALSYIPEVAWNESGPGIGHQGLYATGGGSSTVYSKPSWQAGPGVPNDGARDVPDVALTSAGHDGYLLCQADAGADCMKGNLLVVAGTSVAAPAFSAILSALVEGGLGTGQRQGNPNPVLYAMANRQYAQAGTKVFHDVTSGSNSVPGVTGFSAGTGYDQATGLGSVDGTALVNNWGLNGNRAKSLVVVAPANVQSGVPFAVNVTAFDAESNLAAFYTGTVQIQIQGSIFATTVATPHTFTPADAGSYTFTVTVNTSIGYATISAYDMRYPSGPFGTQQVYVSAGPVGRLQLIPQNNGVTVAGTSVAVSVTSTDLFGNPNPQYTGTIHFTSTDPQATLPPDYTFPASAAGSQTFSVTFRTSGPQNINATDTKTSNITGTTIYAINVSPGPTARFKISSPTTATAGVQFVGSLTAIDQYDNVATGYSGIISFTTSDRLGTIIANPSITNGTGNYAATLRTSGTQTITVTDSLKGISGSVSVAVSPAQAARFTVTAPISSKLGLPFSILVVAYDVFSNSANGYMGNVAISSTDAGALLPPVASAVNGHGVFNVTLNSSGIQTITATDTQNATINGSATSTVGTQDPSLHLQQMTINMFRATTPTILATFIDDDTGETGSHLSVTVDWGDGSPLDTNATILQINALPNTFEVLGKHTYSTRTQYLVKVMISDSQGGTSVVSSHVRFLPRSFSF